MSSTANSHLRSRTRATEVRRRSSAGKLGAVKLPADSADAGAPAANGGGSGPAPEESGPRYTHAAFSVALLPRSAGSADAPSPREPKLDAARAPAAAATAALPEHAPVGSGTRRFGQLLSEDRTLDRWLDSQMHQTGSGGAQGQWRACAAPGEPSAPGSAPPLHVEPPPPPAPAGLSLRAAAKAPAAPVDSAATQIVQKALKFITLDSTSGSPKLPLASPKHTPSRFKSESASFLDKARKPGWAGRSQLRRRRLAVALKPAPPCLLQGLEAINGVGKLMEGFALSLDNVIGQAFDEWGSVPAGGRPAGQAPGRATNSRQPSVGARRAPAPAGARAEAPVLPGRSSAAAAGRADGLDAVAAPPEKENRPQAAPGAPANIAADGRPSDRMRQKLMSPLRSKLGDASGGQAAPAPTPTLAACRSPGRGSCAPSLCCADAGGSAPTQRPTSSSGSTGCSRSSRN
jgi:hypothetical protein